MNRYALIGYPLGHSLSPQIHERLFRLEGIDAAYSLLAFPPEEFEAQLPHLRGLCAFNITIPYKRTILPHLDQLDDSAALYGAVNSVLCENGRMYGSNTDCGGFLRTMERHGIALDTTVCVLGAGGVGRMFAIECARQGAQVDLAVRASGREKALEVAAEVSERFGARIGIRRMDSLDGRYGLLINATPVGMFPNIAASPATQEFVSGCGAVFDCIYNPSETLLLSYARQAGIQAVGGMDMLVWQAAIAHERWHGSHFTDSRMDAVIDEMHRLLIDRETQNHN